MIIETAIGIVCFITALYATKYVKKKWIINKAEVKDE